MDKRSKQNILIRKVFQRKVHIKFTKFIYPEGEFNTEFQLCKWLDDNTTGLWGIEFLKIGFANEADAIIYRLRFDI